MDQERTGFQHQHAQRRAARHVALRIQLGGRVPAIHAGTDDDDVEVEVEIGRGFGKRVADEPAHHVEAEARLLDVGRAAKALGGHLQPGQRHRLDTASGRRSDFHRDAGRSMKAAIEQGGSITRNMVELMPSNIGFCSDGHLQRKRLVERSQ
jgi:hypothetical protein